jgi:hypothetical protein
MVGQMKTQERQENAVDTVRLILQRSMDRAARLRGRKVYGANRLIDRLNQEANPIKPYSQSTISRLMTGYFSELTINHIEFLRDLCTIKFLWNEEANRPFTYEELAIKLGLAPPRKIPTTVELIAQINELPELERKKLKAALAEPSSLPLQSLLDHIRARPLPERMLVIEAAIKPEVDRPAEYYQQQVIAFPSPATYSGSKSVGAEMETLQELIKAELILRRLSLKEYAQSIMLSEKALKILLERGEFYGDRENILSQLARNLTHPERQGFFYDAADLEAYCQLRKDSPNGESRHHLTNGFS